MENYKNLINITISVDDLHPEIGWGCENDESVEYLEKLNKEFGCKFTLFIPSNYHRKYPLSEHKDWVDFWKSKDWVELAAHGHYHQCERDGIGECEFFELDTEEKALNRIMLSLSEWIKVGHRPIGWRNPGWLAHPNAVEVLGKYFDYAAIHEEHNHGIPWKCKVFNGCDGIHQTDISMQDSGTIMFQSHIAGDWNDNVWNEENYQQFRSSLSFLLDNYDINFVTLSELSNRKNVIYLIKVGDVDYSSHTIPLIQSYANKFDADVVVFDEKVFDLDKHHHPNFLIFDIFKHFKNSNYDKMLYMDLDIRIMDSAPNIFDEVKQFGMVQDHKADVWRREKMQEWLDKHHSDMKINHYFNGGIIVSDKNSIGKLLEILPDNILAFWETTKDMFPHGYNQNILNYLIIKSKIEYEELPDKWNKVCRKADGDEYFIHYVANKDQIQTEQDKFKDNRVNSNIEMTL